MIAFAWFIFFSVPALAQPIHFYQYDSRHLLVKDSLKKDLPSLSLIFKFKDSYDGDPFEVPSLALTLDREDVLTELDHFEFILAYGRPVDLPPGFSEFLINLSEERMNIEMPMLFTSRDPRGLIESGQLTSLGDVGLCKEGMLDLGGQGKTFDDITESLQLGGVSGSNDCSQHSRNSSRSIKKGFGNGLDRVSSLFMRDRSRYFDKVKQDSWSAWFGCPKNIANQHDQTSGLGVALGSEEESKVCQASDRLNEAYSNSGRLTLDNASQLTDPCREVNRSASAKGAEAIMEGPLGQRVGQQSSGGGRTVTHSRIIASGLNNAPLVQIGSNGQAKPSSGNTQLFWDVALVESDKTGDTITMTLNHQTTYPDGKTVTGPVAPCKPTTGGCSGDELIISKKGGGQGLTKTQKLDPNNPEHTALKAVVKNPPPALKPKPPPPPSPPPAPKPPEESQCAPDAPCDMTPETRKMNEWFKKKIGYRDPLSVRRAPGYGVVDPPRFGNSGGQEIVRWKRSPGYGLINPGWSGSGVGTDNGLFWINPCERSGSAAEMIDPAAKKRQAYDALINPGTEGNMPGPKPELLPGIVDPADNVPPVGPKRGGGIPMPSGPKKSRWY
jgi:hypothetical protein